MKIALFGGSFDPVHREHVELVQAAVSALMLDRVIVIPAYISPFKKNGAIVSAEERIKMCRIAFESVPQAEVSDFEIRAAETSYTYLTCAHFKAQYASDELYFLLGADALETFPNWKFPEKILENVTLAACDRGNSKAAEFAERIFKTFGASVCLIAFCGKEISSTRQRVELAFGKYPHGMDGKVIDYIREKGLYSHPAILPALALEKAERREHSFRVALLAAARSLSAGISQEKAVLASALHDCGKYVLPDSALLNGFVAPEGVPSAVLHQYSGAYLAEHVFQIKDQEVLDAIRYHTSGRENMTELEKLVYLADMLEEGRDFEGIGTLREAFWSDLDKCLLLALKQQCSYLKESGKPVYPLTEAAFLWANANFQVKT